MLIPFGERIYSSTEPLGNFSCPVCQEQKPFIHVVEKNYFILFFIKLFPLHKVADYHLCTGCGHAFKSGEYSSPLYFSTTKFVLAYLLAGFGLGHQIEQAQKIFTLITGSEIDAEEMQQQCREVLKDRDPFDRFHQYGKSLSWHDKSLVIQAAYLLLFSLRSIQYEERLQVNLIANAFGVGIEGVNEVIRLLQAQQYKGISPMDETLPM